MAVAIGLIALLLTAHRSLLIDTVIRSLTYDLRHACGRAVSLPAVDAYAQSRRLQPLLRGSETAAPPASVPKAPPAERGVGSQSFATEAQRKTRH